ncbi:MAG: GIN domain-containing protein [Bacteroidales bacterium]
MKTTNLIISALLFTGIVTQSCTKQWEKIEGTGTVTSETLNLSEFNRISMEGADNVFVSYGEEQHVEVTGHPNIISRIRTDVVNDTWYIELERGNYGRYELTYYLTLPTLEGVSNTGSGNVTINTPMATDHLEIQLMGSGNFSGFQLTTQTCQADMVGSGNCEISVMRALDANLEGSGSLFYKGTPSLEVETSGSGQVVNVN